MGDTVTLPNLGHVTQVGCPRPYLSLVFPLPGRLGFRAYSLRPARTWVGRALPLSHEGIQLSGDPALSGVHAQIVSTGLTHQILDCGSKNGTYVGRQRLTSTPQPLHDGDVLRLGNTFFIFCHREYASADFEIEGLLGASPRLQEVRARVKRVAAETLPVLLYGETGTGKEVVAQALHLLSRRPGELVRANCAAISASLAESELFGHVDRAFTGAQSRLGLFRRADRGTLLLDEIGDMPLELQAKLLRVLEDRQVTPVGSDRALPVDVRVIAASHRNLQADSETGRFRRDLYMRLSQLRLVLPTLRSRREDILLLFRHASPEATPLLTPDLIHALLTYHWPGNVRELLALANQLRVDGVGDEIRERLVAAPAPAAQDETTPFPRLSTPPRPPGRPYRLPTPAKAELQYLLYRHLGTVKLVAAELGCSRRQVQRWLEEYELDADDYRKVPDK
jgi:DNA-binding NtrC family response regulator